MTRWTLSWADKIIVLKNGQIIQQGTPKQIYRQPVNEYTAGLFGSYNHISPVHTKAFGGIPGVKMNGKDIFVRPESLKIAAEENHVNRVEFFGSHYEIEVSLAENIITVKTEDTNAVKGDTIYLCMSAGEVWYM